MGLELWALPHGRGCLPVPVLHSYPTLLSQNGQLARFRGRLITGGSNLSITDSQVLATGPCPAIWVLGKVWNQDVETPTQDL